MNRASKALLASQGVVNASYERSVSRCEWAGRQREWRVRHIVERKHTLLMSGRLGRCAVTLLPRFFIAKIDVNVCCYTRTLACDISVESVFWRHPHSTYRSLNEVRHPWRDVTTRRSMFQHVEDGAQAFGVVSVESNFETSIGLVADKTGY